MGVIQDISPNDAMVDGYGIDRYLELGRQGVRAVRLALEAAGNDAPRAILDMPSGHGRVLRALKAAYPEAHLTACDLDPDAVAFCAQTFGATPIVSDEDPARVELGGPYDVIWVGSLLTHLDAHRWPGFLELWRDALTPDGVVVFTTHGRKVIRNMEQGASYFAPEDQADAIAEYERTGFAYRDYYGQNNYGASLSHPSWVLRRLTGRVVLFSEAAWGSHDVYAVRAP